MPTVQTVIWTVITALGGIVVGIIGYFLKRTISIVDRCEQRIEDKASKVDLNMYKAETEKKTDKLSKDIEIIKQDYLTKEDFYRELSKLDRKIDQVINILIKGGGKNE